MLGLVRAVEGCSASWIMRFLAGFRAQASRPRRVRCMGAREGKIARVEIEGIRGPR